MLAVWILLLTILSFPFLLPDPGKKRKDDDLTFTWGLLTSGVIFLALFVFLLRSLCETKKEPSEDEMPK